jgi:hypothetical protein
MGFPVPSELDFQERGFLKTDRESTGAPFDWAVAEFAREYPGDIKLLISLCSIGNFAELSLLEKDRTLCHIHLETVSWLEFQSWHGEQVIRVYADDSARRCVRAHYSPMPSIIVRPL